MSKGKPDFFEASTADIGRRYLRFVTATPRDVARREVASLETIARSSACCVLVIFARILASYRVRRGDFTTSWLIVIFILVSLGAKQSFPRENGTRQNQRKTRIFGFYRIVQTLHAAFQGNHILQPFLPRPKEIFEVFVVNSLPSNFNC